MNFPRGVGTVGCVDTDFRGGVLFRGSSTFSAQGIAKSKAGSGGPRSIIFDD